MLAVAVSAWVRRSKLGLGLFAIQDDEEKAAGLGLATGAYKAAAFVLGGTFLGVAGSLYAYYVTFLNVSAVFDIVTSMLIVLAALLGGRGTLWGPVLGAFIIEPLANFTSTSLGGADAGAIRLLLFGGLLGRRGALPAAPVCCATVSAWKNQKHDHPERLSPTLAPAATTAEAGRASDGSGDLHGCGNEPYRRLVATTPSARASAHGDGRWGGAGRRGGTARRGGGGAGRGGTARRGGAG